mmetsp:Transcript_90842/g.261750  ORF Transcript_90842/g.261750 Transcript_90842/m.261750 type:complete len:289 (+) Transcript_90842:1237-2103(+)
MLHDEISHINKGARVDAQHCPSAADQVADRAHRAACLRGAERQHQIRRGNDANDAARRDHDQMMHRPRDHLRSALLQGLAPLHSPRLPVSLHPSQPQAELHRQWQVLREGPHNITRRDHSQQARNAQAAVRDEHAILPPALHLLERLLQCGASAQNGQRRPWLHHISGRALADPPHLIVRRGCATERPSQVQGRQNAEELPEVVPHDEVPKGGVPRSLLLQQHGRFRHGERRPYSERAQQPPGQPGDMCAKPSLNCATREGAQGICPHEVVLRHHTEQNSVVADDGGG